MPSFNLNEMIAPPEMCLPCQIDTAEGNGTVTPRPEGQKLPDPNDGDLCRRCGVRLRAPVSEPTA
ncbi:MAG: hypothetical protein M3P11_13260 [Actinomycetota bacterium]|nr:hypothetical protein [Actinomycetota bacterium]